MLERSYAPWIISNRVPSGTSPACTGGEHVRAELVHIPLGVDIGKTQLIHKLAVLVDGAVRVDYEILVAEVDLAVLAEDPAGTGQAEVSLLVKLPLTIPGEHCVAVVGGDVEIHVAVYRDIERGLGELERALTQVGVGSVHICLRESPGGFLPVLDQDHLLLEAVGDYRIALVSCGGHVGEVVAYAVQLALVHYHAVAGVVVSSVQDCSSFSGEFPLI